MTRFIILCVCIATLSTCELFMGIDEKRMDGFVNFDYVRDRISDSYASLAWKEAKNDFSWNKVMRSARSRISSDMSSHELMDVLKDVLARLKDAHISFSLGHGTNIQYGHKLFHPYIANRSYRRTSGFTKNAPDRVYQYYLQSTLRDYGTNKVMMYGAIVDDKAQGKNLGYVYIRTFADNKDLKLTTVQKWAHDIDAIVSRLAYTDGLILDIRQNPGGYPGNMLHIVGRFVKERKHFMDMYMKNGPGRNDFAAPYAWHAEPQGPRQYTKPIVLITDGGTGSNGEYMTLALRRFDYVTHVGQATKGITGYMMVAQMPNGWGAFVHHGVF